MSRETVRSATSIPSFSSSPWIRGAPQRVRGGHAGDQSLGLGMDGWATSGRAAGELGPVLAEAAPLPPQDGVGGHDRERLPPPGPDPGQPDPEEAIGRAQLGSGRRSLVHGELLPQGKVLDRELPVAAEEEGEQSKQMEQESDHRAWIVSGSGLPDQPFLRQPWFWRRTTTELGLLRRAYSRRHRPVCDVARRLTGPPWSFRWRLCAWRHFNSRYPTSSWRKLAESKDVDAGKIEQLKTSWPTRRA